jgi:hypothetical protein
MFILKKKTLESIESLDSNSLDEDGFIEGDLKGFRSVASFNFGANTTGELKSEILSFTPNSNNQAASLPFSNQNFKNSQRGLTPAVNGELYTLKRCYQFRPSTIRKLNELKAKHSNVNVYLNTIIDEAISYYYDHVASKSATS